MSCTPVTLVELSRKDRSVVVTWWPGARRVVVVVVVTRPPSRSVVDETTTSSTDARLWSLSVRARPATGM